MRHPLPRPDRHGRRVFADGSRVTPSLLLAGAWLAWRRDGSILRGGPNAPGHWDSVWEAAAALADAGEGPAAVGEAA